MALRIALVSREFPPDHGGGIGSYVAGIAPALARAGARGHVITRRLAGDEADAEMPSGVTVHRVEMGDRSGESCIRASIVVAKKLVEIVGSDGLEAIEFAEYEAMGSAWLALRAMDERASRVPVAVHLHSPTELNAELNGHDPGSLDRGLRELIEAEDTDAIVIGTWPYMHCSMTLAALDVLCPMDVRIAVERAEPVGRYRGWRPSMGVTQWSLVKR